MAGTAYAGIGAEMNWLALPMHSEQLSKWEDCCKGRYFWELLALKVFPYVDLFQLYFSLSRVHLCARANERWQSSWLSEILIKDGMNAEMKCHFSPLLISWIHKDILNMDYVYWEDDVSWQQLQSKERSF